MLSWQSGAEDSDLLNFDRLVSGHKVMMTRLDVQAPFTSIT